MEYTALPPFELKVGRPLLMTTRSDCCTGATEVPVIAWLFAPFGSGVDDDVETLFTKVVPNGMLGPTANTMVKVSMAPDGREGIDATIGKLAPGMGTDRFHPAGPVNETNVAAAGKLSDNVTKVALSGPLFTT